jgi:hypothetical protein
LLLKIILPKVALVKSVAGIISFIEGPDYLSLALLGLFLGELLLTGDKATYYCEVLPDSVEVS